MRCPEITSSPSTSAPSRFAPLSSIRAATSCKKVRVPIEPYVSRQPGWAEQEAPYFWESLCVACQRLWEEALVPRDAIAGVALTTQRATMVNVDEQGRPLRAAIVWLDRRRTEGLPLVGGLPGAPRGLPLLRDDRHGQHHQSPLRRGHSAHRAASEPVPGAYSLEIQIYRGYWMVSLLRHEFGLRDE